MLVNARAKLVDGLFGKKLLKCPLLDVLRLILLELGNELDGTLKDGPLVLLTAGDDLGKFVDTFVDGFATTALD